MLKARLSVLIAKNLLNGQIKIMNDCDKCYRIICRSCQWEAVDADVIAIKIGSLTNCPNCGWKPGELIGNEAKTT